MDATAAYRMAYPEEDARAARTKGVKLLKYPQVIDYLEKRKVELHETVKITQEEWLRDVIEMREMCMGRKTMPMATFYEGELVTGEARKFDPSGAKHALELLGRHLGVFNDKLKVENAGGALFVLNMGGRNEGNTYEHEAELIEAPSAGEEDDSGA
jgi:phage terminase small subunit